MPTISRLTDAGPGRTDARLDLFAGSLASAVNPAP